MDNPWKSVSLSDYENHMKLDTVKQLQVLNEMMKCQLNSYDVNTAMILGVAGGNGLEHIDTDKYSAVYGIDVNSEYLLTVKERYTNLEGVLNCLCIDLTNESDRLPTAELVIANLLIEYIGYECFQNVIGKVKPKYVSCGIQIDQDDGFVSESPYIRSFDSLGSIHHQIDAVDLENQMTEIGYHQIAVDQYPLPNGKNILKIDFAK